jgi:hypothetical protein
MVGYNFRDGSAKASIALPASAGATSTAAIDLGEANQGNSSTPHGDFVAETELLLTAPSLNATQFPANSTATYEVDQSPDGGNWTTLMPSVIVQSANNGAAGTTYRAKLPTNVQRYIRATVTTNANAGNCAGATLLAEMLF